jgi:hypothetical protein
MNIIKIRDCRNFTKLMGMDEKNIGKYKSLEESLGDY